MAVLPSLGVDWQATSRGKERSDGIHLNQKQERLHGKYWANAGLREVFMKETTISARLQATFQRNSLYLLPAIHQVQSATTSPLRVHVSTRCNNKLRYIKLHQINTTLNTIARLTKYCPPSLPLCPVSFRLPDILKSIPPGLEAIVGCRGPASALSAVDMLLSYGGGDRAITLGDGPGGIDGSAPKRRVDKVVSGGT